MGLGLLLLAVAGCQTDTIGSASDQPAEERVSESELRAFCPQVVLRAGTAFFTTYEKGGEGNPENVVYQASISDVTRSCTYDEGTLTMNIAVAGKIVPGPASKPGALQMPIRVAVTRGEEVLYSQLHRFPVTIGETVGATQFVFNDPNVTI